MSDDDPRIKAALLDAIVEELTAEYEQGGLRSAPDRSAALAYVEGILGINDPEGP